MASVLARQMLRRGNDQRFSTRWLAGEGIDISTESGSLSSVTGFFPLAKSLHSWQPAEGDTSLMASVADNSYDFVHSSHYLAQVDDPLQALASWIRICRPGGHLIITAPDEDMVEQGVWPSKADARNQWTFTIHKPASWSPRSINLLNLLVHFQNDVEILKIEKLDSAFDYSQSRPDASSGDVAESAIEIVLRKRDRSPAAVAMSDVEATFTRAAVLHQVGHLDEALEGYKAVLELEPEHLPTLKNLALLLSSEKRERLLRQALAIKADDPGALQNLALLLAESGRFAESRELYERALQVLPDDTRVISALCDVYVVLDELDAAIALLDSRSALFPAQEQVGCLLAKYCLAANRTGDALAWLARALSANPGHAEAHILLGRVFWKLGEYERGAEEIRWIWHAHSQALREQIGLFVDPAGLPIRQDGRTVVLSSDGTPADALQFVRYARLLKAQGARVVLECQPELVGSLRGAHGVDEVVALGQLTGEGDVRVPMHNLIGAFRTTLASVPAAVPYIDVDASAWRERLASVAGLRVGLYWDDEPKQWRDQRRAVTAAQMLSLPGLAGAACFALRTGLDTPVAGLTDWSSELGDAADLAAFVKNLDLVITVDSAVAHLAGALGKPVWLLTRFDAEWVWLEQRTDSPWYPTLTLFRQPQAGEWTTVLATVSAQLQALAAQHARPANGVALAAPKKAAASKASGSKAKKKRR